MALETAHFIGAVGGNVNVVSVTPVVEATPDYSTGDVMGGKMTFSEAARNSLGTGYITSVVIKSLSDITVPIDVVFFKADPADSTFTENSAIALDSADVADVLGVVQVFQWFDLGTPVIGVAECRIPYKLPAGSSIYAVMVPRGTINLGSVSDLIVDIGFDQN